MSALKILPSIIHWAIQYPDGKIPPPLGILPEITSETLMSDAVKVPLQKLCTLTSTRLSLGSPPLGDASPITADTLFTVMAVGAINAPELALALLENARVPQSWGDYVVRHGLFSPVRRYIMEDALMAVFMRNSPLTALITSPPKLSVNETFRLARRILENSYGRRFLTHILATPTDSPAVRHWRAYVLEQLIRTGDTQTREIVVDVYETALLLHRDAVMRQTQEAYTVLVDMRLSRQPDLLNESLAMATWWKPLWLYRRSFENALRSRPYLDYGYLDGMKLYLLAQKLGGI